MPSAGGTRMYLVARGQRQEPLKPDPPQSSAENTLGRGGERQVNSPTLIGAGIVRSPLSERLVRLQQGIVVQAWGTSIHISIYLMFHWLTGGATN